MPPPRAGLAAPSGPGRGSRKRPREGEAEGEPAPPHARPSPETPVLAVARSAHATVFIGEHHVLKVHTPTPTVVSRFLQELVAGRYLNRIGFAHCPSGFDGLSEPGKLLMRRVPGGVPVSGLPEDQYARMAANGGLFRKVMVACAEALASLHATGLMHADVKPDNILLQGGAEGSPWRACLIDLGNAIPTPHEPHATFFGPPHLTSPLAFTDPTMILQRELEGECETAAAGLGPRVRNVAASVSVASAHGLRAGWTPKGSGPEPADEDDPGPEQPLLRAIHTARAPFPRSTQNDVYGLAVSFLWLLHRVALGRDGAEQFVRDLSEGFRDDDPVAFLRARIFGPGDEGDVRQGVAVARFMELRQAGASVFAGPVVPAAFGQQVVNEEFPAVWDYEHRSGGVAHSYGSLSRPDEPGAPTGMEMDLLLDWGAPASFAGRAGWWASERSEGGWTAPPLPPLVRRLDVCLGALAGRWSPPMLRLVRSVLVRTLQPVALFRPTAARVCEELLSGCVARRGPSPRPLGGAPAGIAAGLASLTGPPPSGVPLDLMAHVVFGWRPPTMRHLALALALHRRVPELRESGGGGGAAPPGGPASGPGSGSGLGVTISVAHAACAALGCLLSGMAAGALPERVMTAVLEAAHRADAVQIMEAMRDVADMQRLGSDASRSAWSRRLVRLGAAPEDLRWLGDAVRAEALARSGGGVE